MIVFCNGLIGNDRGELWGLGGFCTPSTVPRETSRPCSASLFHGETVALEAHTRAQAHSKLVLTLTRTPDVSREGLGATPPPPDPPTRPGPPQRALHSNPLKRFLSVSRSSPCPLKSQSGRKSRFTAGRYRPKWEKVSVCSGKIGVKVGNGYKKTPYPY